MVKKSKEENVPPQKVSEKVFEEAALASYIAALTPEDLEEMRKPSDVDVLARLRAHIEALEASKAS